MRVWLLGTTVALLLALPAPSAVAEDAGSRDYMVSYGWLTNAVDYQNTGWIGSGTIMCDETETLFWGVLGDDTGCIGGTRVLTSEAWALYEPGTTMAQIHEQGVTLYQAHELTVNDDLTGPNVMIAVCNVNPDHDLQGGANCDSGETDNIADAFAYGCGLALVADSTGIHEGNFHTIAIVFTIGVDIYTNEVCLGTAGTTNVVYS